MTSGLRIQTRILPGHRIEISAPGLPEGSTVDVIVLPAPTGAQGRGVLEFLDSLPSGPRSFASWEEMERHFQEERDAWGR